MLTTGGQRVAAFVLVGVSLVIMADYGPTAPIAVGFAYLFLLSTLYLVGPVAFERLQKMIGAPAPQSYRLASGNVQS